ncbi:MAG: hypothetical protein NSGCLCUN01_00284 [uncultured Clostridium sp.]
MKIKVGKSFSIKTNSNKDNKYKGKSEFEKRLNNIKE